MSDTAQARIPALTVRQPWAWAIAHGSKRIENRPRRMNYRGPLWLHGGARSRFDESGAGDIRVYAEWLSRLGEHSTRLLEADQLLTRKTTLLDFGAILAQVTVTGFHIELADEVRRLPRPVPCKGALGLWTVPDEAESAARAQTEER